MKLSVKVFDDDFRKAIGVNEDAKFNLKIKPSGWVRDASAVLSVYCLAYSAWKVEIDSSQSQD